jgi:hypothetical protein
MGNNNKCVWVVGREYHGKTGGVRTVIRQDEHTVTIKVIENANGYTPGATMTISRESMKRWCHSDSKQIGERS